MKKVYFFLIAIMIVGCQSQSGKIESLIEKDLSERLNDFKSYQAVNTSDVTKLYSSPYDDEAIYNIAVEIISCQAKKKAEYFTLNLNSNSLESWRHEKGSLAKREVERLGKVIIASKQKIDSLCVEEKKHKKTLVDLCSKFKKEFVGYNVVHKFRAKNKLGVYVLSSFRYDFNKEFSKILKVVDIENEQIEYGVIERVDSAMTGLY